jgi:hypothetical protein
MRIEICNSGLRETDRRSGPWISAVIYILLVTGFWIFVNTPAIAQEQQQVVRPGTGSGQEAAPSPPNAAEQSEQTTAPAQPEAQPKKKKKLGGPAVGSGIVPVLGYIFPFSTKDKVSPPLYHRGGRPRYGQRKPRLRGRGTTLPEGEYL